jgi:hypothetical protein
MTDVGEQKAKRLRFIQDDSCHWYAIPAEQGVEFERWVKSFEDETEDQYDGPDFENCRLNHPSRYTFVGLKENCDHC